MNRYLIFLLSATGAWSRGNRFWAAVSCGKRAIFFVGLAFLMAAPLDAEPPQPNVPEPTAGADRSVAGAGSDVETSQSRYAQVPGSRWTSEGHPDWNIVRTTVPDNPTEWQVYSSSSVGKAHCGNPGMDGTVVRDSGNVFSPYWVGVTGFYIVQPGDGGAAQAVSGVADANHLTLATKCMGEGVTTYQFVTTSNRGYVNVVGSQVTWVGGQPFNVFATGRGAWTIGGNVHTCSSISENSAICDTDGNTLRAPYSSWANINDEVSTWRLQKIFGANEENLACEARAVGFYECRVQTSGRGIRWPWLLGNGAHSFDGTKISQIGIQPNGDLTLGGHYFQNSVLIPATTGQYKINPLRIVGGASGSDHANPTLAARSCGDVCAVGDVGLGIDTAGEGDITFTNHYFKSVGFKVRGTAGDDHLVVQAGNGSASLSVDGPSSAADMILMAKGGAGMVRSNSLLGLAPFTVATLPACDPAIRDAMAVVSDARAPSYNAAVQGGGRTRIPVFCDGSVWTAH